MITKRVTSTSREVRMGRSPVACLAICPNTVESPVATHTPTPSPLVQSVPWRATLRVSRKEGSVASTAAGTALDSPVRIERSNLRSVETCTKNVDQSQSRDQALLRRTEINRMSAGTFVPMVSLTMSPTTSSVAGILRARGEVSMGAVKRKETSELRT